MEISFVRLSLVLLVPVLGACYVPVPADITAIDRGADVRVLVSPDERPGDGGRAQVGVTEYRGEFLRLTTDSLTIATELSVPSYFSTTVEDLRQPVTLPRAGIVQVTVPTLHRGRTFALVGGAAVVAVVMIADLFNIRGEGGSRAPRPPPDTSPFIGRW